MKKILVSISMLGVFVLAAVGGTYAYFSDNEVASGNTFVAGTMNLVVDYEACRLDGSSFEIANPSNPCTTTPVSIANAKPGDGYDFTIPASPVLSPKLFATVTLKNLGSVNGAHALVSIPSTPANHMTFSGTCTEPEVNDVASSSVDDCFGGTVGTVEDNSGVGKNNELSDNVMVTVQVDNGTPNPPVSLASLLTTPLDVGNLTANSGITRTLKLYYSISPSVGNEIQDDGAVFPLSFSLTQN